MQRSSRKSGSTRARSKKTGRLNVIKLVKYAFLALLLSFVIGVAYNYRHAVLYWLGYKTDKRIELLTKEERQIENLRIYKIVARHKDKIFGLDISHYQGKITWDSVQHGSQAFPVHFVFVRATAGKDATDKEFSTNWKEAKKRGFICGAYHYYRPDENSLEQANLFINAAKLGKGDLPPVLDIEQIPAGQSIDSLKAGLRRWLYKVEEHYGVKPIIYSGESFYSDFLKEEFADYTFWIANYSFFSDEIQQEWKFWQFTDKANINGVDGNVDLNIYNGNFSELQSLTIP